MSQTNKSSSTATYANLARKTSTNDVCNNKFERKLSILSNNVSKRRTSYISNENFTHRNSSISLLEGAGERRKSVARTTNPSFRTIGNKVQTLVRTRMALQSKHSEDEEEEIASDLPTEPRFSTSMSPEAQFALMKGYEDTVYRYITKQHPEYKVLLQRSITPVQSVDFRQNGRESRDEKSTQKNGSNSVNALGDKVFSDRLKTVNDKNVIEPKTSVKKSGQNVTKTCLESSRQMKVNQNTVVTKEKQLIITHRLQNAMDILDTLKCNIGLNTTSPRIRNSKQDIQPIAAYRQWMKKWGREFELYPH